MRSSGGDEFAHTADHTPHGGSGAVLRRVLRARLRCYGAETLNALRRSWQLVVLLVTLVPQMLGSRELGAPLSTLSDPGAPLAGSALGLLLIQGAALLLALAQRKAIDAGEFGSYLRTLPIPPRVEWVADLVVLLVADTLLWLYLLLGSALASGDTSARGLLLAQLLLFATSLLLAQRLVLLGRPLAAAAMAAALCALQLTLRSLPTAAATGTAALLGAGCAALLLELRLAQHLLGALTRPRDAGAAPLRSVLRRLFAWAPAGHIILSDLLGEQRRYLLSRSVPCMFWPGLIALALARGAAPESALELIVLATGLSVLPLGRVFQTLAVHRRDFDIYLASLPMRRGYWAVRETGCVALLSLALLLPFHAFFVHRAFLPAPTALAVLGAYVPLVAAMRAVAAWTHRHDLLAGLFLVAGWTALLLQLI